MIADNITKNLKITRLMIIIWEENVKATAI